MVEMDVTYEGDLRCEAVHGPSGATLRTDAPVDNHGLGQSFSPTDLVATALGTCLLTILGIVAGRHGVDLSAGQVHVSKEMTTTLPRRIARLTATIRIPTGVPAELQSVFEKALRTCPVSQSLHPDVELIETFVWDAE